MAKMFVHLFLNRKLHRYESEVGCLGTGESARSCLRGTSRTKKRRVKSRSRR